MGKHSDFRISSFQVVTEMNDEFYSLTGKLKNILKSFSMGFLLSGGGCGYT